MPSLEAELELERERVRDLLRYYNPNGKRERSAQNQNGSLLVDICDSPDESPPPPPASVEVEVQDDDDAPDDSRLLSHDPTLTAFAQLGAFRLNCQPSFISLMDHGDQYILAEATRSVSLDVRDKTDPGDEVYLAARILDMVWGVCPSTIQVFTGKGSKNFSTPYIEATQDCYVMNDVSAIESFKTRPYVAGWPHMRFYAEVPIHSPTGHVIGTYCVVDNKPREGLDKPGLAALSEIASAIMKHLELVQMQQGLQRAGEMVKGLEQFDDHGSNVREGWNAGFDTPGDFTTSSPGTVHTVSGSSLPQTGKLSEIPPSPAVALPPSESRVGDGSTRRVESKILPALGPDPPLKLTNLPGPRERKISADPGSRQESLASLAIKKLFSRVSRLIREALDLDGIIFVNVCLRDIPVILGLTVSGPSSLNALRFPGLPRTPATDPKEWLHDIEHSHNPGYPSPPLDDFVNSEVAAKDCHQNLAASDLFGSSLGDGQAKSPERVFISNSTLRGLLQKYRHGHIFVLNEDGSIARRKENMSEQDAVEETYRNASQTPRSQMPREERWARQLLAICPGAWTIIFFPLWDPQRDQWFAGSLAWTIDPQRVLESVDLAYLAAFGSYIMSEKSRLDALSADRAKADFISSVSHELRSPLQGILASAEALQHTSTGSEQDDMIRTVAVCGEVLLETMDQILDYSKVSNSRTKVLRQGKDSEKASLSSASKSTSVDMISLVENVVDGIFSGHQYRKSALGHSSGHGEKNQEVTHITTSVGNVMVILTIGWQESWVFRSDVGDWKRILMNLFGNSLKYTAAGFIHVSLRAARTETSSSSSTQVVVTIQVEDSGKGMSKDYQKYELYTPFAQEDSVAAGTGLGLSIVRQLVVHLGGTIDVHSEVGYGTTVNVSVPVALASEPRGDRGLPTLYDIQSRCQGFNLCLVGFDVFPDLAEPPTGILTLYARRMMALKLSITGYAVDWFEMEISTASSLSEATGDVVIALRSQVGTTEGLDRRRPLIIFEDIEKAVLFDHTNGVFILSQPVGPHKLAKVLTQCLEYRSSLTPAPVCPSSKDTPLSFEIEIGPSSTTSTAKSEPTHQEAGDHQMPKTIINKASVHQDLNDNQSIPAQASTSDDELEQKEQVSHMKYSSLSQSTQVVIRPAPRTPSAKQLYQEAQTSHAEEMLRRLRSGDAQTAKQSRSVVLLVEDNIINMKILANLMKRNKQDYITAENGLEALQKYQETYATIKLVFMDISMPIMDGLTSTRQIRRFERENSLPRTRIIALTCFSSEEYQRAASLSGADMFLIKPVPMRSLQPILEMDPEFVADKVIGEAV